MGTFQHFPGLPTSAGPNGPIASSRSKKSPLTPQLASAILVASGERAGENDARELL